MREFPSEHTDLPSVPSLLVKECILEGLLLTPAEQQTKSSEGERINEVMNEINRSLIVVKPKQPCLAWLQSLDEKASHFTLADIRRDCTAFLVPECLDDEYQEEILALYCDVLLEHELASWVNDETAWPPKRNLKLFKEWFETEFYSLVVDAVGEPLQALES